MTKIIQSDCGNTTTLAGDEVPNQINVSQSAKDKINELCSQQEDDLFLRVAVAGGGCSGFQYVFGFDDELDPGDIVNDWDMGRIVVDSTSIEFMKGATVDFVSDFSGEFFTVNNPHAQSECGCGSSFSPNQSGL